MTTRPSQTEARLPDKIHARHRDRTAVVYVRQSTVRQVFENQESTRPQYALADKAIGLGWRGEQIMVIDNDLGRSATSTLDRPGFQRLVAEVGLGHVGLVLGIQYHFKVSQAFLMVVNELVKDIAGHVQITLGVSVFTGSHHRNPNEFLTLNIHYG